MQFDFSKLKASGALDGPGAYQSALHAAEAVINRQRNGNSYARDAVTFLCQLTAEKETAEAGVAALFPALIEPLNDSFDPRACSLYDRVMAQVIDFYRRLPEGKKLDAGLRSFGLASESDLLDRKAKLWQRTLNPVARSSIKKAVLLSRVTIGADIAVTSVLSARLREALPNAELVLLGSHKLRDLYGGDSRLRIRALDYDRSGGVLSRLQSWLEVVRASEEEESDLKPDEFILIDPDSRLTQLGLLPVLRNERNYFFFESRSYRKPGASRLGELASRWVDELFAENSAENSLPYLALPAEQRAFGQALAAKLRGAGPSQLVTVSLGVGGNPNKRLSDSFEAALIQYLSEGARLILDKGSTREEREQIDRIVALLRAGGKTIVEVKKENASELLLGETIGAADVVTWQGGIGEFAGLIAAGDRYIGYDSAGQHIAAALGVPVLTIFVNSNSPVFAERWRSYGAGEIDCVIVEPDDQELSRIDDSV